MSKNIVFEGWLTKSPPSKRIWRKKWRRRWFALRQSGELPGQYFLDYYADQNCRRPKGTINLDLCEQVDAGLHMERTGSALDPKLRGSVFTIQTQSRTYHLEADCEADMEKWVDAICRVCGLRATEDSSDALDTYQNNMIAMTAMNDHYECADSTGPYIPISECITGERAQDSETTAFSFNPKNNVRPYDRVTDPRAPIYTSQPYIRVTNVEFSENESNISDEDCKSLNASQSNIPDWSVTKTFTKLAISPKRNGTSELGPPVPPRPPKTFARPPKDVVHKDTFQGPKIQEPVEIHEIPSAQQGQTPWLRLPRRKSNGAPHSPGRSLLIPTLRYNDEEEENSPGHLSMQYYNLPSLPPAVDRALKPRHSSHSFGHINHLIGHGGLQLLCHDEMKPDVLQYLDLDLHTSAHPKPAPKPQELPRKMEIHHGKSLSAVDADCAYKTVDFLKTEAFNITRQDAEASRSHQY